MEYTDLLTWGIMAIVIALGAILLADWLIDRAFESYNYEKSRDGKSCGASQATAKYRV